MKASLALLATVAVATATMVIEVRNSEHLHRPSSAQLAGLSRAERRSAVFDYLRNNAFEAQVGVLTTLRTLGVTGRPSWIGNRIFVDDLPEVVANNLAARDDVIRIRPAAVAKIPEPLEPSNADFSIERVEWNIEKIGATQVWNITQGEGIVVGSIDSGVRYSHEALVDSYRGNLGGGQFDHDFNWFDPVGSTAPEDSIGHGTHTTGTIVGSKGIGVAPGAKWIAGKGCRRLLCPEEDLLQSAEFVLAPFPIGGGNPDPTKGADVVSNSWGGGEGDDWFRDIVSAWRDAGMIPVFAQGNSGPQCNTANSPGDMDIVIGVGATNDVDSLAFFSSRGPGANKPGFPALKPDISAPGQDVRSAFSQGDSIYVSQSGTSMACPHISGVVALMLSVNPSLTYEDIYSTMTKTAVTNLQPPTLGNEVCGGVRYDVYPNNHYGFGRVDALAAVRSVITN